MLENPQTSQGNKLVQTLDKMNTEAGFLLSVLTNSDGLLIASSSSAEGRDPHRQSAIAAKAQQAAQLVQTQLEMGITDEFSVYDEDGRRLVCRPLRQNGHNLVLAVLVPNRGQAYRRATNKAINRIRREWAL